MFSHPKVRVIIEIEVNKFLMVKLNHMFVFVCVCVCLCVRACARRRDKKMAEQAKLKSDKQTHLAVCELTK